MTQQTIDVGSAINDGTGDPARTAFTKSNDNFTELYARSSTTLPQGRLTLATGTPVMTTTQPAKTTIYYTPYNGNLLPIYDGTYMVMTPFAELSVATTDITKSPAAIGNGKLNDWYVWNDAGTLRLGHDVDWLNNTTRTAGHFPQLIKGIWLNNTGMTNGPATQRGTYVGTTLSDSSAKLNFIHGTAASTGTQNATFGVWNCYNRRRVCTAVHDTTASWTYATTNTWRAFNNSGGNSITWVDGLGEEGVAVFLRGLATNAAASTAIGINIDATTGAPTAGAHGFGSSVASTNVVLVARYCGNPGLGSHFAQAMEFTQAATATFYGDLGTDRAELQAEIWM